MLAVSTTSPVWRWCRFEQLTLRELQFILCARQQVFGLEQQCVYQDIDGLDERAFHLAAWSPAESLPLAYARLLDPDVKYAEPSMGRVIILASVRGTGLGRGLVRRVVDNCEAAFPRRGLRISAQAHLEAFYASFGFGSVGAPYLEDGIAHIEMVRPSPGLTARGKS